LVNDGNMKSLKQNWSTTKMRNALESFAKSKNMDPLIPATWHTIKESISKSKHGKSIMQKVKGGYFKAVRHFFPSVRFANIKPDWSSIEQRRLFFEKFANKAQINPQNAHDWYLLSISRILEEEDAREVLLYHKNSVTSALQDLFPDIGLDSSKFSQYKRM